MCKIVITHRKPKNAPHTRTSQVSTKWVRTRTSQLATAHRNSQLAIAHRKSCLENRTSGPRAGRFGRPISSYKHLFRIPFLRTYYPRRPSKISRPLKST